VLSVVHSEYNRNSGKVLQPKLGSETHCRNPHWTARLNEPNQTEPNRTEPELHRVSKKTAPVLFFE